MTGVPYRCYSDLVFAKYAQTTPEGRRSVNLPGVVHFQVPVGSSIRYHGKGPFMAEEGVHWVQIILGVGDTVEIDSVARITIEQYEEATSAVTENRMPWEWMVR